MRPRLITAENRASFSAASDDQRLASMRPRLITAENLGPDLVKVAGAAVLQ